MQPAHVVLLHGQPGTGSDWRTVVERLPDNLQALALDRPGYRGNPAPAGGFAANAHELLGELDSRDIEDAVVVGHSYGGGVALATALLAPQRVRSLVLVASVGPGCLNGWDRLLAAPITGPVCAVAAWWLTPWFARWWVASAERLRRRPLEHDELINWETWGQARHTHGAMWRTFLVEQRALVSDLDELVAAVPTIRTTTLVLADPADTVVPIQTAQALAQLLPNSRLIEIPGGGHHPPRRTPQAVADAIASLLDTV